MQLTAAKPLRRWAALTVGAAAMLTGVAGGDVLPDDRADVFWSKYSGGGMEIRTESVLVRKKFSEKFALEGSYLVDKVSGASVDVLSNASEIKDERKQKSATVDYVHDKTTYTLSYTDSTERDYISNTTHFALSQDMFGDLTTVTLGFTRSRDAVGENDGTADRPIVVWLGHADSRSYEAGLSQVLTKDLIGGVTFEVITDSGYLANPYRFVRYYDTTNPRGYSLGEQAYPDTRTSTAVQGRAKYYLPWRAAVSGSYRYFRDTWGIKAGTAEVDYTHPISNLWILEGRVRYYRQDRATFYGDIFSQADAQNFEARDRNLAQSTNTTLGAKVTYAFLPEGWKFFKRGTATVDLSRVRFRYGDFRDIKDYGVAPQMGGYPAGAEPLYHFNAFIAQLYISMFF